MCACICRSMSVATCESRRPAYADAAVRSRDSIEAKIARARRAIESDRAMNRVGHSPGMTDWNKVGKWFSRRGAKRKGNFSRKDAKTPRGRGCGQCRTQSRRFRKQVSLDCRAASPPAPPLGAFASLRETIAEGALLLRASASPHEPRIGQAAPIRQKRVP